MSGSSSCSHESQGLENTRVLANTRDIADLVGILVSEQNEEPMREQRSSIGEILQRKPSEEYRGGVSSIEEAKKPRGGTLKRKGRAQSQARRQRPAKNEGFLTNGMVMATLKAHDGIMRRMERAVDIIANHSRVGTPASKQNIGKALEALQTKEPSNGRIQVSCNGDSMLQNQPKRQKPSAFLFLILSFLKLQGPNCKPDGQEAAARVGLATNPSTPRSSLIQTHGLPLGLEGYLGCGNMWIHPICENFRRLVTRIMVAQDPLWRNSSPLLGDLEAMRNQK
ncbi:hypothetical protein RND71_001853 [Anisodus tanguticus]|uniref:Uncharacterized protein n=1 Tax=Anisodus tanguticus TaxID=243964 RepID=A0AAE1VW53_9SOLA|nr:hypothetical protein RND71_001853 [Anisodus tanguticus]